MILHKVYSIAVIGICLLGTSCSDLSEAKGVVTLDGNPVEGASVTFVSESGSDTYSAVTDAKGEFTLVGSDQKKGAKPGTYKVLVTKSAFKGESMAPPTPGGTGGTDAEKEMKDAAKGGGGAKGGIRPPMGMMGGNMQAPGIKSELPAVYASSDTTPIKLKVPADNKVLTIELKSK